MESSAAGLGDFFKHQVILPSESQAALNDANDSAAPTYVTEEHAVTVKAHQGEKVSDTDPTVNSYNLVTKLYDRLVMDYRLKTDQWPLTDAMLQSWIQTYEESGLSADAIYRAYLEYEDVYPPTMKVLVSLARKAMRNDVEPMLRKLIRVKANEQYQTLTPLEWYVYERVHGELRTGSQTSLVTRLTTLLNEAMRAAQRGSLPPPPRPQPPSYRLTGQTGPSETTINQWRDLLIEHEEDYMRFLRQNNRGICVFPLIEKEGGLKNALDTYSPKALLANQFERWMMAVC